MSKNTYRLINPYIEGSIDTKARASNPFNAAKKIYKKMSDHITNQVDNFYITLENLDSGVLSHFKINEKMRNDNGDVDFKITELKGKFPEELDNKLRNSIDRARRKGGRPSKHKYYDDDSTSDSSSSDSYMEYFPRPINRFLYYYLPYYKLYGISPVDASRLFLPMFGMPINPSLELRFDLYQYTF